MVSAILTFRQSRRKFRTFTLQKYFLEAPRKIARFLMNWDCFLAFFGRKVRIFCAFCIKLDDFSRSGGGIQHFY
jgi:hypothetical protein